MSVPKSYAEQLIFVEKIAHDLERIAYRLRQGAISYEGAADKLRDHAHTLDVEAES